MTIHTSVDFYINEVIKSNIEKRSFEYDGISQSIKKSWQKMVRQCLIEIYGKHLGGFSAKGARGKSRPRIDPDLYFGLWSKFGVVDNNHIVKNINCPHEQIL